MKVRIGVGLIPTDGQHRGTGLAELVDDLEELGIDSVWLSDQVSSPDHADPLIGLAYAAGRTEKLKLGTGVLVLPGRNPALVAAQLAGLAALAPGRVLPAFGVQPATPGDRTMYPAPAGRRGELFEEAIKVVRALLTEPVVTHHGEFFHLQEASVGPLPAKPLDLWLGGRLPVSMDRIGRLGDGWLGSFITPAEAQRCREQIEAAAAEAGRGVEADHYGTNIIVAPDGTDEAVVDALVARAAGRRKDISDPNVLVCRGWQQARTQVRAFVDVGLTKFVVRPIAPVSSRREFLEQFTQELLPLQNINDVN
ncbi:putative F420-dependent oxidoreductase [Williamsia limnetica]|uniref:Putative F420-dependent oxidoreductase n=2 Tax=Williamsia limnetica TaxID=882452 RepID=A0A318RG19_WILLI|nr:TIGR03854 family LLM class F420-dependent oxidoreductase [Williamsia limnetica]PYE11957.1 putative F420-dependent oxidoreductase [Williamsia limnetica]